MGSHVADHCLRLGYDVVGVDDLSGGYRENVSPQVDFRLGSITDRHFVARIFEKNRFECVYHLAAYAAEGLSHFIRAFNYETNLVASMHLLNQSILNGVQRFVFTSSIAVYGTNQTPMTEDLAPFPEDPYGISKYAVELDLKAAHEIFGIDYTVFRPHNVYGERQNIADRYRNVIGIFMNQVLHGEPMTIFGDGQQSRAFSHIDDVAPIIAQAPQVKASANMVFNVGADLPYTILELAHAVAAAFSVEPRVTYLPPRHEVVHAFAAHDRVRTVFSPPEPVPFTEGINRMARWVLERGAVSPVSFAGEIEVGINMPPSWRAVVRP